MDEEKEEQINGISVMELIERLKSFATDHPDAYIQADTRICLLETTDIENRGYYLHMAAEGDEIPEKKNLKPVVAYSDNPHDLDYAYWH